MTDLPDPFLAALREALEPYRQMTVENAIHALAGKGKPVPPRLVDMAGPVPINDQWALDAQRLAEQSLNEEAFQIYGQPYQLPCADPELPGMWEQSDLQGGSTDV